MLNFGNGGMVYVAVDPAYLEGGYSVLIAETGPFTVPWGGLRKEVFPQSNEGLLAAMARANTLHDMIAQQGQREVEPEVRVQLAIQWELAALQAPAV